MLEHPCLSAQHEHFSRPALSGCLSVLRAKQGLTLICGLSPRRTCDCHWCPCYPNSWTSSVVSICRHTAAATIQQCWRAAPLALARPPIPLPGCLTVTSLCVWGVRAVGAEESRRVCMSRLKRKQFKAGSVIVENSSLVTHLCFVEAGHCVAIGPGLSRPSLSPALLVSRAQAAGCASASACACALDHVGTYVYRTTRVHARAT